MSAAAAVDWLLMFVAGWVMVLMGALVVGGFRDNPWPRRRHRSARHPDPSIDLADAALALQRAGADEQWVKDYVVFDVIDKDPRALEWAKVRQQCARFR